MVVTWREEASRDTPFWTTPVLDPVALYVWAAQHLKQLDHGMRQGDELSPRISTRVNDRLAETRLGLGDEPGTLAMHATTLLSYLTAQTIVAVNGATPVQRACRACGRPFTVLHGRQRSCCPKHARRHRV